MLSGCSVGHELVAIAGGCASKRQIGVYKRRKQRNPNE